MVSTTTHQNFLLKFDVAMQLIRSRGYSIRKACKIAKIDRDSFSNHFHKLKSNASPLEIENYKESIQLGRKKYLSAENMKILKIFSNSLDCCNFPVTQSSFMQAIIQLKALQMNVPVDDIKPPSTPTLKIIINQCKLKKKKVILFPPLSF